MSRKYETLSREDFIFAAPDEIVDELIEQLHEWEGGDICEEIDFTTDSMGRIDSESSPRPHE